MGNDYQTYYILELQMNLAKSVSKWIKANPNTIGLIISPILAWASGRQYIMPDTLTTILAVMAAMGISAGAYNAKQIKKLTELPK